MNDCEALMIERYVEAFLASLPEDLKAKLLANRDEAYLRDTAEQLARVAMGRAA